MDVADLIASFGTGTYQVTRRAAASITRGRAVAGPTSSFNIVASVQPASGRDLLRLPEGRRSIETRIVFTTTQLLVGQRGSGNDADLIAIDGGTFEVQYIERWLADVPTDVPYWRCVVQARPSVTG